MNGKREQMRAKRFTRSLINVMLVMFIVLNTIFSMSFTVRPKAEENGDSEAVVIQSNVVKEDVLSESEAEDKDEAAEATIPEADTLPEESDKKLLVKPVIRPQENQVENPLETYDDPEQYRYIKVVNVSMVYDNYQDEGTVETVETSNEADAVATTETVEEEKVAIADTAARATLIVATEKPESDLHKITLRMIDEKIARGEKVTTGEIIWAIMNYLIDNGFEPEAAAGVCGNAATESNYNPKALTDGFVAMFQWNVLKAGGYWWYDVKDWMIENGYDKMSFEGQVKAVLECSNRGFLTDKRLEHLKQIKNPEEAAEYFAIYYEGCEGGSEASTYYKLGYCYWGLGLRKSEAKIAYNMYLNETLEYNGQKIFPG